MDDLQKLLKATTVEFNGNIDFEGVRLLLKDINKQLGKKLRISCLSFSGFFEAHQEGLGEPYVDKIRGSMSYIEGEEIGVSVFHLIRSERDEVLGHFSGLRFEPTVGYRLDEIDPTERELYAQVKVAVDNIFLKEGMQVKM